MMQATAVLASTSESSEAAKQFEQQLEKYIEATYPYSKEAKKKKEEKTLQVLESMQHTAFSLTRKTPVVPPWRRKK